MCSESSLKDRTSQSEIEKLSRVIENNPIVKIILTSIAGYVLILDRNRQILAANKKLISTLQKHSPSSILGQRLGELFLCVHSRESETGCGTSSACQDCGALMAMVAAQTSHQIQEGECFITSKGPDGLFAKEYALKATPLQIESEKLLVFVVYDISDQKWRNNLERIFLHDMNNTLSALSSWGQMLENTGDTECVEKISVLVKNLINTVESQQILVLAENNDLKITLKQMDIKYIFSTMEGLVKVLPGFSFQDLKVKIEHNIMIQTDPLLIFRILSNMLINAFEATPHGQSITLEFRLYQGCPRFSVHNPGVIPEAVAKRVFNRSYSTKGQRGRGWGTYSIKLLGEKFLKGTVAFTSTIEKGTEFFLILQKDSICQI
ncbi:MAG: HAMP domain-containing histidine kinase [Spirochaetales bacterium]|nr:HAMP domain-containing histidine kinase [Spirochaetales bacterium]